MTNTEYFEKNNISFSQSMKFFIESKINSFDKFLKCEHSEHKFKCGDIVVLQLNDNVRSLKWNNNVVFMIIKCKKEYYCVKYLTPTDYNDVGDYREFTVKFIDENCKIY